MKMQWMAVMAAVLGLAGCQTEMPAASRRLGPADEQLVEEVRYRFAQDPLVARAQVGVSLNDGEATLRGRVPLEVRARATAIAQSTPGVRHVKDEMMSR